MNMSEKLTKFALYGGIGYIAYNTLSYFWPAESLKEKYKTKKGNDSWAIVTGATSVNVN